jgi:dihydropteroate synthase
VPFWGCLDCKNAVVTGRKLPQILALLNHLERERERLDAAEWATLYGRSRERIVGQILPAFPEDMVLAARAVAEAEADLLYLPVAGSGFASGAP